MPHRMQRRSIIQKHRVQVRRLARRSLLPQRLPGHVLANLSPAPGFSHQVTKHPKNHFLLVLLPGARARALPQRLHPAQVPISGLDLRSIGLSHAWTPSSNCAATTETAPNNSISLAAWADPFMEHVMYHTSRKWPQDVGVWYAGHIRQLVRSDPIGVSSVIATTGAAQRIMERDRATERGLRWIYYASSSRYCSRRSGYSCRWGSASNSGSTSYSPSSVTSPA